MASQSLRKIKALQRAGLLVLTALLCPPTAYCQQAAATDAVSSQKIPASLSLRLARESRHAEDVGQDLQLLLAIAAMRAAPTYEARSSLLAALNRTPLLSRMLWGHRGVNRIAFTPDGKKLVSASGDGTLTLFDAASGERLAPVTRTDLGEIWHIQVAPDGGRLLVSGDKGVAIWRVGDRMTQLEKIDLKKLDASAYGLSENWGRAVVTSGGKPGSARVLDAASGETLARVETEDYVSSASLNPDGTRLVVVSGGIIAMWVQGESGWSRTQLNESVHFGYTGVVFSPDGRFIASARWNDIDLWDAKTGKRLPERVIRVGSSIDALAFSKDGERLVVGTLRNTAEVYATKDGQKIGQGLGEHPRMVYDVAFNPVDGSIATCSWNSPTMIWRPDAHSALSVHTYKEFNQGFSARFAADGASVVAADIKNVVMAWQAGPGYSATSKIAVKPFNFRIASAARDGRTVATAGHADEVFLYDASSGALRRTLKPDGERDVQLLALSDDGKRLAAARIGGSISLWKTESDDPKPLVIKAHPEGVEALALSHDGKWLASGGESGVVKVWNAETGKLAATLKGHVYDVKALAFSRDGRRLASGGLDMRIRVWDLKRKRQVGPTRVGHKEAVTALEFSPDGRQLYSSGRDYMLLIWEGMRATPLALRPRWWPGGQTAEGIGVHPSGRSLVTAEGAVRIWSVSDEEWLERACAIANRNFYAQEWRQFFPGNLAQRKVCPDLPFPDWRPVGTDK